MREIYLTEHLVLLAEMQDMVSVWCQEDERGLSPKKLGPLRRRERARVQAAILSVMRGQHFAGTVDEIIWALIDVGLWLPTLRDGVTGYMGELQRLQRLYLPMGSVERVELVAGDGCNPESRWLYHGEEPWLLG